MRMSRDTEEDVFDEEPFDRTDLCHTDIIVAILRRLEGRIELTAKELKEARDYEFDFEQVDNREAFTLELIL